MGGQRKTPRIPSPAYLSVFQMRAPELLASEPCSPPALRDAWAGAWSNANYEHSPLNQKSLQAIPQEDVEEFKSYISTIPWDFGSFEPSIDGRLISSEADVRQFVDSAIILPAWPVILAMVPLPAHGDSKRGYDLVLKNEQSLDGSSRPDEAIARASVDSGRSWFRPIVLIELKGPGVLSSLESMGGGNMPESDDLMSVTRQLRKYSVEGRTPTLFVMDNTHALYLRFSDATDENDSVEFAVASSGADKDRFPTFTIRELFVFSAWRSFSDLNIVPRFALSIDFHSTR